MATPNAQGIQTLLEAEKEASKIVAKARQYRVQRLKDARIEAQKEIEALKAQKQAEYAAFEKSHYGSSDDVLARVTADADAQLLEIQRLFEANKAGVLDKLLGKVLDVKSEVHVNAKVDV